MQELIFHRRFWGKAAVPFLVFLLARFLFVLNVAQPVYSPDTSTWHETRTNRHVARIKQHKIQPLPEVIMAPIAEPRTAGSILPLQSSLHEFTYKLSGDVTCGDAPCQAEIRLVIQTDHNPEIKKVLNAEANGHFEYQTTFNAYMKEPVDWRLMVYTPRTYPVEFHGRQILTDDSDIEVTKTIRLP